MKSQSVCRMIAREIRLAKIRWRKRWCMHTKLTLVESCYNKALVSCATCHGLFVSSNTGLEKVTHG